MSKRPRLGTSDFDEIISKDFLIVDKTLFIKEFMENGVEVSCILRPRRFGKSTNLAMLMSFLSIGAHPTDFSRYLISKEEDFVEEHCGQYPVVYLDLKDCTGRTWAEMYQSIWLSVRKMVDRHETELTVALSVQDPFELSIPYSTAPINLSSVSYTLKWLITSLYKHHKKEVIVLVDEYDTPLNCAFRNGFHVEASDFFEHFFSSALKGNSALEKACLMGIVELHGTVIQPRVNNILVYSVADMEFSSMFGFSETEVRTLFGDDVTRLEQICEWYKGYSIGSSMVMNPWSIMNYYSYKVFSDHWVQSASSDALFTLLSPHVKTILTPILALLYETREKFEISPLDTEVNYSDTDWDTTSILHFLVHAGYLTYSLELGKAFVSCPNQELFIHWKEVVTKLIKFALEPEFQYRFEDSIIDFNTTEIEALMKEMLPLCSRHDVKTQHPHHVFYFGCIFTMLHDGRNVIVSSKRETVHDERYDIRIEFRDLKKVIIIEFKKSSCNENLDEDAETGLVEAEESTCVSDYLRGYECLLIGVSFSVKAMSTLKFKIIQN